MAGADVLNIASLAARVGDVDAIDDVLAQALDAISDLIPYDLATVFELQGENLKVRQVRGVLASDKVRGHAIQLSEYPTVQRAFRQRRPIALMEEHHASEEGDPFDDVIGLPHGHSCMVVPLFVGQKNLGVMTFDRELCQPYDERVLTVAAAYGQVVSLSLHAASQAEALSHDRQRLLEQQQLLIEQSGGGDAAIRMLEKTRSPLMRRVLDRARSVAESNSPVLILGETGTGKELLADAIHAWGPRRDGPIVKLNCAAIPEALIESELFGHVEGAFSGATKDRAGRFQAADGGTLFLDEVGELPLAAQAKLLRVLQEGTFLPVGSDESVKVDVRIIAATHRSLPDMVKEGDFREDLYYRLEVFPLNLPPLRERSEDIPNIATSILAVIPRRFREAWHLSSEAVEALKTQSWKGNVRQLKNALERATIMARKPELSSSDLAADLDQSPAKQAPAVSGSSPDAPKGEFPNFEEAQRRHIESALIRCEGKIYGEDGAAALLDMKPTTLQSAMKRLGVKK